MMMNESPYVVHLANMLTRGLVLDTESIERSLPRRRFSLRESNRMRTAATDRRSKMISAPTNFNHVSRKFNLIAMKNKYSQNSVHRHGAGNSAEIRRLANNNRDS